MNPNKCVVLHDRLGHHMSIMVRKVVENTHWRAKRFFRPIIFSCTFWFQGKLIIKSSIGKIGNESISFLKWIQGYFCGPIHSLVDHLDIFMVLTNASTKWSHVCFLITHNHKFVRLLAQLNWLRVHFPNYACELTSYAYNEYHIKPTNYNYLSFKIDFWWAI